MHNSITIVLKYEIEEFEERESEHGEERLPIS